eukprot:349676-Chlamydomonas_euryale.AAC.3
MANGESQSAPVDNTRKHCLRYMYPLKKQGCSLHHRAESAGCVRDDTCPSRYNPTSVISKSRAGMPSHWHGRQAARGSQSLQLCSNQLKPLCPFHGAPPLVRV